MCITLTQNFSKVGENIAQLYRDDGNKNILSTSGIISNLSYRDARTDSCTAKISKSSYSVGDHSIQNTSSYHCSSTLAHQEQETLAHTNLDMLVNIIQEEGTMLTFWPMIKPAVTAGFTWQPETWPSV